MANNRAIAYLDAEDQSKAAFASFRGSLVSSEKLMERVSGAVAGIFSVGVITAGLGAIVREARNAEQEVARLDSVLRATGFASGFVRKELEAMSRALAETSTFDDGDIQTAQAALLKFGNIQGEVFEGGLRAAADLAAFMGTDIPGAAQLVGKALQSPVEGIGALERNIGKLSGSQDRLIRDLVESGRLYEAQGEVLKILQERIGGTAQALNTGLTKATADAGKAWREFLEELGRTDGVVGGTVNGVLVGLTATLKALRDEAAGTRSPISDLVEEWAKLGKGLPGGGLAGVLDLAAARNNRGAVRRDGPTVSGRISGVLTPEEETARAAAAAARRQAEEEAELALGAKNSATLAKMRGEEAKRASEERLAREKRLQEEGVRGWVQYAEAVFAESERLDTDLARITAERFRREEEERLRGEQQQVDAIERQRELDEQAGLASNKGRSALQEMQDKARETRDVARELGLSFQSAFENAVVGGNRLSEVIKALGQDVARIFVRKSVTEPLAAAASEAFTKAGAGSFFTNLFGGARADGGPVSAGRAYLVGERGPELFVPRGSGTIVPNGAGGGGVSVTNVYNIDSRSDRAAIVAEIRASEQRTLAQVVEARSRGGAFARAF
jgi:hypothetical protein